MKRPIEEIISKAFDVVSRTGFSADQATEYLLREGVGQAQMVAALVTICRDLLASNIKLESQLETAERIIQFHDDHFTMLETRK